MLQIFDNGTDLHPRADGFLTSEIRDQTIIASTGIVELKLAASPTGTARGFRATWSIGRTYRGETLVLS